MGYYDALRKAGFRFTGSVPAGPAYIMPDGRFLDVSSSMHLIDPTGTMIPSHPAIDQWLFDEGLLDPNGNFSRVLCESDNAIRVNDGTNLFKELVVGLPPLRPSEAQLEALEDWLYHVYSKGGVTVGNAGMNGEVKHYDFSQILPEDIVKRIKRFYSSGRLLDSMAKESV